MPKEYGAARTCPDAPLDVRLRTHRPPADVWPIFDGRLADVGRRFLKLSAAGAALTFNGLRPLPGSNPLSVPSFFAGWLTSELAPHNLAVTVGATAAYLKRKR